MRKCILLIDLPSLTFIKGQSIKAFCYFGIAVIESMITVFYWIYIDIPKLVGKNIDLGGGAFVSVAKLQSKSMFCNSITFKMQMD